MVDDIRICELGFGSAVEEKLGWLSRWKLLLWQTLFALVEVICSGSQLRDQRFELGEF